MALPLTLSPAAAPGHGALPRMAPSPPSNLWPPPISWPPSPRKTPTFPPIFSNANGFIMRGWNGQPKIGTTVTAKTLPAVVIAKRTRPTADIPAPANAGRRDFSGLSVSMRSSRTEGAESERHEPEDPAGEDHPATGRASRRAVLSRARGAQDGRAEDGATGSWIHRGGDAGESRIEASLALREEEGSWKALEWQQFVVTRLLDAEDAATLPLRNRAHPHSQKLGRAVPEHTPAI
ncbi:hypothetical protein BDK51DRAFT_43031 [Blyttiomyces helicus]|uniref:Uncharacterized protein n=1 Tax=Blyttiomyces helicus TaxID=388810 RepID=A0A4P9W271_9FUNG|nr:hypothetical protein BDK51DRAFT_43031 [Blyttiomyces helicus]|eukprot:RKO84878.1 hypothetical protein BDK51DRAFT_43031 [Blyttiomyces helicus]